MPISPTNQARPWGDTPWCLYITRVVSYTEKTLDVLGIPQERILEMRSKPGWPKYKGNHSKTWKKKKDDIYYTHILIKEGRLLTRWLKA